MISEMEIRAALPRTPVGKLSKKELYDEINAKAAAAKAAPQRGHAVDTGMKELREKVAVVTGAASGFGREFAIRCADEGMKVVLTDIDEGGLATTVARLKPDAQSLALRSDVSNADSVEHLAKSTYDRFGACHLLFNNAGVGTAGPIWLATLEDWKWTFGINVMGVVHGLRSFVPRMLEQKEPVPYRQHGLRGRSARSCGLRRLRREQACRRCSQRMPLSRITRAGCRHRRLRSLPGICRYPHLEFRTQPPCGTGGVQPGSEAVRGSHQTGDQVRKADCC